MDKTKTPQERWLIYLTPLSNHLHETPEQPSYSFTTPTKPTLLLAISEAEGRGILRRQLIRGLTFTSTTARLRYITSSRGVLHRLTAAMCQFWTKRMDRS